MIGIAGGETGWDAPPCRPMCTDDIDPETGETWGVEPTESGEQS